MDKYTVVVEQRKMWYGWRRGKEIVFCATPTYAATVCNNLNANNSWKQRRYIVISIDKV